jgi:quercetin dioxygenase-like cupin family protein
MVTRRDLIVAVAAATSGIAVMAWAQSTPMATLPSSNFEWADLKVAPAATGEKRAVFSARTATLDQLAVHVTTINPGQRAHDPHRHWEEELVIVKEGMVESMQNGEVTRLGPGSVIFEASNDLHGIQNVGDSQASYYVIKWFPPGALDRDKQ